MLSLLFLCPINQISGSFILASRQELGWSVSVDVILQNLSLQLEISFLPPE